MGDSLKEKGRSERGQEVSGVRRAEGPGDLSRGARGSWHGAEVPQAEDCRCHRAEAWVGEGGGRGGEMAGERREGQWGGRAAG